MPKHGKKYLEALEKVDREKLYTSREAMELVKEMAFANFDETVEVHMRLGIDPRQADQQMRGVVLMPAGLGRTVRILVFAEGEAERIARDAGADIVGSDEVIAQIEGGFVDFDVTIATPDMMRKVGKLGRYLGPRGLMPNPKDNTVVAPEDIPRVIEEVRAGRAEYRNDRTGNLHVPIGKASFEVADLMTNFATLMDAIRRDRPASAKGQFIRRLVLKSTMSPGVKVDPFEALGLEIE